jgi:hypothetical protein
MIEFLTSLEEIENSLFVEVAPPLTMMTEYLFAFAFIVFLIKRQAVLSYIITLFKEKVKPKKGKKVIRQNFFPMP